MPRRVFVIAAVAMRLWLREVARLLGAPVSRVVGLLVTAAACAAALGALLALASSSALPAELPSGLREAVLGTSFGGATLTAGALGVALSAAAPPRTALENLLALVPVGPVATRLGTLVPTLVLGLGFTLALSGTAAVLVVRTARHAGEVAAGLGALLGLVVATLLLATALYSLVATAAARVARVPPTYATALAGAASLAAVFAATLPDVLLPPVPPGTAPGPSGLLPHRAFATAAAAPNAISGLAPLAWVVAALLLSVLAARVHGPGLPPRRPTAPRGTRPLRRSPRWGLLWAELLVLARSPQTVLVAAVLPLAVAGVALVVRVPFAAPLVPPLATGVVLLPALLGLQATGRTLRSDWAVDAVTARPAMRLLPQAAAVALAAAALAAPVLVALVALGIVAPSDVGAVAARGGLAVSLALVCGAVVPWSEQQPLSATAGGLLFALASVIVTLGLSSATETLGPAAEGPLLALAAAVALAGYAGARRAAGGRPDAA
jgi:hypothetical protein